MKRELHVRIRENVRVKFPFVTRLAVSATDKATNQNNVDRKLKK